MKQWRFQFPFVSRKKQRVSSVDEMPEVNCVDNTFASEPTQLSNDAQALWKKFGGDRAVAKSFWIEKNQKPTCELEKFALQVGEYHLGDEYLGVEYWVQLRREKYGDDDGKHGLEFHFDKDETAANADKEVDWHHPTISTVTYLDCKDSEYPAGGVPLVVFQTRADGEPAAFPRNAWVIPPLVNRHVSFEGNLLHGCPYDLIQHLLDCNQDLADTSDDSNPFNRIMGAKYSRLSVAVNIWRDHKPMGIQRIDSSMFNSNESTESSQTKKTTKKPVKNSANSDEDDDDEWGAIDKDDVSVPFLQCRPSLTRNTLVSSQTDPEDLFFLAEHRDGDTNPLPVVEVGQCFVQFLQRGGGESESSSDREKENEDVLMVHYLDH